MNKVHLKYLSVLCVVCCTGCANFLTTTANKGISYGMTQETVLKLNQKKGYKILSQDENTIVVEGIQEQLNQPAEKIFHFENNRLVSVEEKIK